VHLRRRISTTAHNEVVSKSYSDCLQAAIKARAAAHAAEKATKRQLRREEEYRGIFEDMQAVIAAHLPHRLDAEDREEGSCERAAKRAKSSHNEGFYNEGPAPLEGEFLAKLNRHLGCREWEGVAHVHQAVSRGGLGVGSWMAGGGHQQAQQLPAAGPHTVSAAAAASFLPLAGP